MATKGKKVELYYTSQGTTTGVDSSALLFNGSDLTIHTHGKTFDGTNTWREVYIAGTKRFDSSTDTSAINFVAGPNASIGFIEAGTEEGQSGSVDYASIVIDASLPSNTIPAVTAGKFLHANATTGDLEWVDDYNVKQTVNSTNQESPILLKNGTGNTEITSGTIYASGITVNPSTNSLSISGNLSVTGTASFSNNVTCNNNGIDIGYRNSIIFDGSIGGGTGSYIIKEPESDYMFIASNKQNNRIYLESTYQDAPYFRNSTGDYKIIHAGNISSYIGSNSSASLLTLDQVSAENSCVPSSLNQVKSFITTASSTGGNDGFITTWSWNGYGYKTQLYLDVDQTYNMSIRHADINGNWTGWRRFLNTGDSVAWQGSPNNLVDAGNEVTMVPSGFSGDLYFNYKTVAGQNGNITQYKFCKCQGESYSNILVANAYVSSDRRLKSLIKNIDNKSLEDLFYISDNLFKVFILKQTGNASYGFVAQELAKYIPEAINPRHSNSEPLTVNYDAALTKILASVVNEIKKIKKELKALLNQ